MPHLMKRKKDLHLYGLVLFLVLLTFWQIGVPSSWHASLILASKTNENVHHVDAVRYPSLLGWGKRYVQLKCKKALRLFED